MPTATASKPAVDQAPNTNGWKPELHDVPLEAIDIGANVRTDVGAVDGLASSIQERGVLSPVRVAELPPVDGVKRYLLIYGQRRVVAARQLGLASIPAIVDPEAPNAEAVSVAQLVENLQREDLNALDTAKAYRSILDRGVTQRDLGTLLGVSQPTIANTLAVLKQPEAIQQRVASGELTRSHVEVLAKLPAAEREEVARRVVEHELSTRDLEAEIDRAADRQSDEDRRRDARKNRDAELLAAWIALLTKKKADPATTTIVGHVGTPGDGVAALATQGWTKARTASRGVDVTWTERAKGICDCDAFELSYTLNYMSGRETYKANVRPVCISKKHQAAASKAEREARDAQHAEQLAVETKAREEREAALAPLVNAATTAIPPIKAKLILFVALGGGHDNGYWMANHWIHVRNGGEGIPYGEWRDRLWAIIDALPHEKLLVEIAGVVAQVAVDAGGKVREAIDGLLPVVVPSQAEAAERVAVKRAARRAAKVTS